MRDVMVAKTRSPLIFIEWQLIAFLWACYILNQADRQVVYTLFPALQQAFGFSNVVLGLTGALFLWVFGAFSPIAGILGDRFSKSKLLVASLLVWSFLTLLSGLAPNGQTLLTCRALLGVSESFFMPAGYALIAAAHGPGTRSRAIALFGTSQLVGVAFGGSLSALIAQRFNWRVAFWVLGGLGILLALPLSRFFQRMPPEFATVESGPKVDLTSFLELFKIPTLRIITFAIAVCTFGLFLVYTWLPTFLYDKFHIGLARAGFEASVYPQVGTGCGF
jgi:predicted MFS family arabinose efflux permease